MIDHTNKAKCFVISPSTFRTDEQKLVHQMFELGLEKYHLRKPDFNDSEWEEYILSFKEEYRGRMVIHHRLDLADKFGLGGVHFRFAEVPDERPSNAFSISCSTHSWQEVQLLPSWVDYTFVSPVFDSISKQGYQANTALLNIPESPLATKLIALGGIDKHNSKQALDIGYDGLAFLGTIWQEPEKEVQHFEEIQKQLELYRSQLKDKVL